MEASATLAIWSHPAGTCSRSRRTLKGPIIRQLEPWKEPMSNHLKFYIDGAWVDPLKPATLDVINPATEEAFTKISVGSAADVDRAVAAARAAFPSFSQTTKEERLRLLRRILEIYKERIDDIARAVSDEMGAPMGLARNSQAAAGQAHLASTIT